MKVVSPSDQLPRAYSTSTPLPHQLCSTSWPSEVARMNGSFSTCAPM